MFNSFLRLCLSGGTNNHCETCSSFSASHFLYVMSLLSIILLTLYYMKIDNKPGKAGCRGTWGDISGLQWPHGEGAPESLESPDPSRYLLTGVMRDPVRKVGGPIQVPDTLSLPLLSPFLHNIIMINAWWAIWALKKAKLFPGVEWDSQEKGEDRAGWGVPSGTSPDLGS